MNLFIILTFSLINFFNIIFKINLIEKKNHLNFFLSAKYSPNKSPILWIEYAKIPDPMIMIIPAIIYSGIFSGPKSPFKYIN